ncbi:MAG: asparagine synthase (glutamine-hydrolyzing) [Acidobacteria bacterium]|nr:asparagine synthase (glutamine-hydrolyzing) [Acidobacteriota bacterium]
MRYNLPGMCGIAGFFNVALGVLPLHRAADTMRRRGPDEEGYFLDDDVGLAARRLSIIDLAGGSQPIANEDGSVVVVQNGEIYNYLELKSELEQAGHRFRTRSDTEVIAHAYEEFGDGFPARLNGMFAIALLDRRRKRLLLVRDPIGKKPLHYCVRGGEVLFGSEIKAILSLGVSVHVDHEAVRDFFYWGFVPSPKTIYKEIRKLPPGHVMIADYGGQRVRSHDDWAPGEIALDSVEREMRETLREAVRRRLIADVEVASFLSGGIDSTIVTGLAQDVRGGGLKSFSIAFDEESFNEAPFARIAAGRFGTEHRELTCSYHSEANFDELQRYFDEPFADYSAIPTALLAQHTAAHVKVCLSGDGGDELFAGYPRYGLHLRYNRYLRLLPAKRILERAGRALSISVRDHDLFQWLAATPEERYLETSPYLRDDVRFLTGELRRSTGAYDPRDQARAILARVPHLDLLAKMRYLDLKFYLPEDLMVKVDRMSMMHSLEVRCPFLDRDVVHAAFRIPSNQHIRNGAHKAALKDAFRGWLPREIIDRPKMGFMPPLATWLRGPLGERAERMLLSPTARVHEFVRKEELARLLREHRSGGRDHHFKLWAAMAFELWAESRLTGS